MILGPIGRRRRVLYQMDAGVARDVRAVFRFFSESSLPGPSLADLDPGPVALERREGFQGSADGTPEPEPARLCDDDDIPAGDLDLE